jgi:hypothetical protein
VSLKEKKLPHQNIDIKEHKQLHKVLRVGVVYGSLAQNG